MNQRHYLLKGTFLLTFTGLLTRIAGFFYKIFLSRTIGAKEIGLFQLTMPVYSFCMALACGGIQTAVSRFTAEYYAKKDRCSARRLLLASLLLSGSLAVTCAVVLYLNAAAVAEHFLLEPGCTMLIQILSVSLPFCVIHSCAGGFFIGQKNITPSAVSQLVEQLLRIGSAFFYYAVFTSNGRQMTASVMALGQLAGELSSSLYSVCYLVFSKKSGILFSSVSDTEADDGSHMQPALPRPQKYPVSDHLPALFHSMKQTLSVSLPLSLNRMLLCILQGIEAALLPQKLQLFGLSSHDALSVYGTLTGMSLPLILFPTAVTGALGTLLLPAISEAQALHQDRKISGTVDASSRGGVLLGIFCLFAYLLFGKEVGYFLFESELAGIYIRKLAFLCPFLYLNTTLTSILHGLGKTTSVFLTSIFSFAVRFAFVLFLVPEMGIDGYIYGVIFSQIFTTGCIFLLLHRSRSLTLSLPDAAVKPLLVGILSSGAVYVLRSFVPGIKALWNLLLFCLIYCMIFVFFVVLLFPEYQLAKKVGGYLKRIFLHR